MSEYTEGLEDKPKLKIALRKVSSISYDHEKKEFVFSCQACLCSDCVNGRQNHCEKITYFRTKQQHTQSEESSASEDEDLGESLDEDDNEELFPQHLCVEDQNLALNSDFRLGQMCHIPLARSKI